ncbi:MAG: asparagine synthetase A [Candidatus Dojkabacteria bacterium]|jgi:asparaginyl-tRNA synthetase|nr:asparagine synthetase A [Candidatus Dojkabacteria bacterium]
MLTPTKSWQSTETHYKVALNSKWYRTLVKLQTTFVIATIEFYKDKGYDFALLPITTGAISSPMGLGSDSSPVKVNIEGIDTYLADSMQFMLEYACRIAGNGTYYLAPSFRGEKADERHLCQFYHSEAEILGRLEDVIAFVEDYIKFLIQRFLEYDKEEILLISGTTHHLEEFLNLKTINRITFEEAAQILDKDEYIKDHGEYRTITSEGEKELMKKFGGFVWTTHFDHLSVPFYQKFADNEKKTALNADLLMGIGETVGSGERHLTRLETEKALDYHQVSRGSYKWYLDMKEIQEVQTSGFGLGVERFFLWLLKQEDIRDMQLVPRFNGQKEVL